MTYDTVANIKSSTTSTCPTAAGPCTRIRTCHHCPERTREGCCPDKRQPAHGSVGVDR